MGRKDKKSSGSDRAQGGIRATEATRYIPESQRRDVGRNSSREALIREANEPFFTPDLSAFEWRDVPARQPVNDYFNPEPARAISRPSVVGRVSLQSRVSPSDDRRAKSRAAARKADLFADQPKRGAIRKAVGPAPLAPAIKPGSLRAKALASRKGRPPFLVDRPFDGATLRPLQANSAKKTVLHEATNSPLERKSHLRRDCVERPEGHKVPDKKKGSGSKARAFIPWCDDSKTRK